MLFFAYYSQNLIRKLTGSGCHTPVARRNIFRPNPRIVDVVTVSVVMGKTRHQTYDSRKYKLMTINLKPKHVMRNSEAKVGGKT